MARRLQCSESTFADKLTGRGYWRSWEMHAIMDILDAPPEEMYALFPPKGEYVPPVTETRVTQYLADRNEAAVPWPILETVADLVNRLVDGRA